MVAVAVWFGGLGPGLTAVVVGWGLELLVLYEGDGVQGLEMTRWAVTLAIALSVIWVSVVLLYRSERATSAASEVEASFHDMARLQEPPRGSRPRSPRPTSRRPSLQGPPR